MASDGYYPCEDVAAMRYPGPGKDVSCLQIATINNIPMTQTLVVSNIAVHLGLTTLTPSTVKTANLSPATINTSLAIDTQTNILTSYIPLPTVFKPPESLRCLSKVYYSNPNHWLTLGPSNTECFPPSWTQGRIYSPGLCPYGYTMAMTLELASTKVIKSSSIVTMITSGICCPSGLYYRIDNVAAESALAAAPCASKLPRDSWSTTTISSRISLTTGTSITLYNIDLMTAVHAAAISVLWECTDTDILQALPTKDWGNCPSPTLDASSSLNKNSMPMRTLAGIIAGVVVFVAFCFGMALLQWRRQRWSRKDDKTNQENESWVKPELDASKNGRVETEGNMICELGSPDGYPAVEIDSNPVLAELGTHAAQINPDILPTTPDVRMTRSSVFSGNAT